MTKYADDKIIVTQKLKFVLGRVENIVEKEDNAGYEHFIFFFTMFSKAFFSRGVKSWDNVVMSNNRMPEIKSIAAKYLFACLKHFCQVFEVLL